MKKIIISFFFVCLIFYMIVFPDAAYTAASEALGLCARAIIPTLFVFLICSNFLVRTGFGKIVKKPFSPIMQPVFGINGAGALAVVLGVTCGYPIGAVCTAGLYEKGDITKNEAQRLLGFTNNSGPLFIIGSVGAVMLENKKWGYLLCGVHIISSLLCGVVLRAVKRGKTNLKESHDTSDIISLSDAIGDSVKNALQSILSICAYTVLFAVIIAMVKMLLGDGRGSLMVCGMLEMTNTIQALCNMGESLNMVLPLISFFLGFGGLCVHLQVISAVKNTDLSLKTYFLGKVMHALFSWVIMFALTRIMF